MSFEQFEKIDGVKLPVAAYRSRQWWSPKKNVNKIAEAWLSEGFYLQNLGRLASTSGDCGRI